MRDKNSPRPTPELMHSLVIGYEMCVLQLIINLHLILLLLCMPIRRMAVRLAVRRVCARDGCFLVDHLPRDGDDVVFNELLADVFEICGAATSASPEVPKIP